MPWKDFMRCRNIWQSGTIYNKPTTLLGYADDIDRYNWSKDTGVHLYIKCSRRYGHKDKWRKDHLSIYTCKAKATLVSEGLVKVSAFSNTFSRYIVKEYICLESCMNSSDSTSDEITRIIALASRRLNKFLRSNVNRLHERHGNIYGKVKVNGEIRIRYNDELKTMKMSSNAQRLKGHGSCVV